MQAETMTAPQLRKGMPTPPKSMRLDRIDHRGYPVPWFVTLKTKEGLWDFVHITPDRHDEAVRRDLCWVSGEPLGRMRSFVIGPMCIVNRISGDPPLKREVAIWSVQVCPFLTNPMAKRPGNRPEIKENGHQAGVAIMRNPGVCAIYTTRSYTVENRLFHLGPPVDVVWYAEGRAATRAEVLASMETGLPTLRKIAETEGPAAIAELDWMEVDAQRWLPKA